MKGEYQQKVMVKSIKQRKSFDGEIYGDSQREFQINTGAIEKQAKRFGDIDNTLFLFIK